MMNIDAARAGDGLLSPKKRKDEGYKNEKRNDPVTATSPDPIFSSEEKKLNVEVPDGWTVHS